MATPIRTREYFRNINLIYFGQVSAIVILALVSYFLIDNGSMGDENNGLALDFQKIIMVAVPLCLAAGYLVFRFYIRSTPVDAPITVKMRRYFVANLVRSACIELPGLLVSVAALITAHKLFLVIVPLILVIFVLFRPSKAVIAQELNLGPKERALLDDPKAIISESLE